MTDGSSIEIPEHDSQPLLRRMGKATEPHPKDKPAENKARDNSLIVKSPYQLLAEQKKLPPKVL